MSKVHSPDFQTSYTLLGGTLNCSLRICVFVHSSWSFLELWSFWQKRSWFRLLKSRPMSSFRPSCKSTQPQMCYLWCHVWIYFLVFECKHGHIFISAHTCADWTVYSVSTLCWFLCIPSLQSGTMSSLWQCVVVCQLGEIFQYSLWEVSISEENSSYWCYHIHSRAHITSSWQQRLVILSILCSCVCVCVCYHIWMWS